MYVDAELLQVVRLLAASVDGRSRVGVGTQGHGRIRLLRTHELFPKEARLASLLFGALERFERLLAVEERRRIRVVRVELPEGRHCVQYGFLELVEPGRVILHAVQEGEQLSALRIVKAAHDRMAALDLALVVVLHDACQFTVSSTPLEPVRVTHAVSRLHVEPKRCSRRDERRTAKRYRFRSCEVAIVQEFRPFESGRVVAAGKK